MDSTKFGEVTLSLRKAANTVSEDVHTPINGLIANRLEALLEGEEISLEIFPLLRQLYIAGLCDASIPISELIE